MGVQFDNVTMQQALEMAQMLLERPGADYCVTPNAEIVYEAMHDAAFAQLINGAALVLPDGAGVVKAARILGTPLQQKVAGIDFAAALLDVLAAQGKRLYLLGSKPGVAEQAAKNLCEKLPGLQIAGAHDGYFTDAESDVIAAEIRTSGADMALVCLGAPKQEKWMAQYGAATGAKLLLGLGGSLDVFAGVAQRAPEFYCKHNLEWFYRLIKNPSRAGRMMKLPLFLVHVAGEKRK